MAIISHFKNLYICWAFMLGNTVIQRVDSTGREKTNENRTID